jgi:hypothetical protein
MPDEMKAPERIGLVQERMLGLGWRLWTKEYDKFTPDEHIVEYRRADLPPTLSQALEVPEIAALVGLLKSLMREEVDAAQIVAKGKQNDPDQH